MAYTINKLATLAGVTTRTLRYYDQIALLKPSYLNQSGYRIYGKEEVDKLQQILFFRELELSLEQIATILKEPQVDYLILLAAHRQALVLKKTRLEALIETIDSTIAAQKGEVNMSDTKKFEAFKGQLIAENEENYGADSRQKYGEERINQSNAAIMNLTEETYQRMKNQEKELLAGLAKYADIVVPSEEANLIFDLHKAWLIHTWQTNHYTPEAHRGLGEMYVTTPEFTTYYDQRVGQGATLVLNKIIQHYA